MKRVVGDRPEILLAFYDDDFEISVGGYSIFELQTCPRYAMEVWLQRQFLMAWSVICGWPRSIKEHRLSILLDFCD